MHTSDIKSWDKQSWNDKRIYLRAFFMDGSIKHSTRKELEEFLVVLAMATPADSRREDDRAEMERHAVVIRHLLQVRLGEELHWRSIYLAIFALIISALALLESWRSHHVPSPTQSSPPASSLAQPAPKR